MINLLKNLDDSFSNSLNSYNNNFNPLLLTEKDNSFLLPLDAPINKSNKNLFITKKTMKEKIEHQKMKLGKENKEIFLNKKEDLKRRNREAAQNSRNKKKLEFMKLIEENKMLKDKIYLINSKINLLCSHCKIFFESNQYLDNNICMECSNTDNNIINNDNTNTENNIELDENIFNNTHNTQSSSFFTNLKIQKLFNFVLISLFSLLCIFCFISNNTNNNYQIRKNLENLNVNESLIKNDPLINKNEYTENKIHENDFFNSFQCKKKSFASMMLDELNKMDLIQEKENNNIEDINKEKKSENKLKNPIYFKLFIQRCPLEEEPENNNNNNNKEYNSLNENKHYIFSTDKTTYRDFYFFCQETDN